MLLRTSSSSSVLTLLKEGEEGLSFLHFGRREAEEVDGYQHALRNQADRPATLTQGVYTHTLRTACEAFLQQTKSCALSSLWTSLPLSLPYAARSEKNRKSRPRVCLAEEKHGGKRRARRKSLFSFQHKCLGRTERCKQTH